MSTPPMLISYDENKRLANIEKHGIDFIGSQVIFDNPMITQVDGRVYYGEERLQSYGILGNRVVFMVWTDREKPHIISIRPTDKQETAKFIKAIYG